MRSEPTTAGAAHDVLDRALPLQQQVSAELRAELRDGLWVGRNDFHTEKEVSERFDVSLITARAVLDRLAEEGWILRSRGRRSRPLRGPDDETSPMPMQLVTGGPKAKFTYEVASVGVSVAPAEACRALGAPLGSNLWQCLRVRRLEGEVHSVTLNVQDPEIGQGHEAKSLGRDSMLSLLHRRGEHVSILRRRITAVAPPPRVARLLEVTLGAPILLYTCSLHRRDGSAIEWMRVYIHPRLRPPAEEFDIDTGAWLTLIRP